jgi:hypothetical protein
MDSNFENSTNEFGLDSITLEERKIEAEQRMQHQNQFACIEDESTAATIKSFDKQSVYENNSKLLLSQYNTQSR